MAMYCSSLESVCPDIQSSQETGGLLYPLAFAAVVSGLGVCLGLLLLTIAHYWPVVQATVRLWVRGAKPLPPGRLGLPFLGETLDFMKTQDGSMDADSWVDAKREKYGKMFKTHLFGSHTLMILGAEGNKYILRNTQLHNRWPNAVRLLMGSGTIASVEGPRHKDFRRHFSHFLGPEPVRRYISSLNAASTEHLDKDWAAKDEVKILPSMKKFTLANVARIFINFESKAREEQFLKLESIISLGLFAPVVDLPWTTFGKCKKARIGILKIIQAEIDERREVIAAGRSDLSASNLEAARDMMDYWIVWKGDGPDDFVTDEEIANNVLTGLEAGYGTTSSALTTILHRLSTHSDVFSKLRKECKEVAESIKAGESMTSADLKRMEYMRNVISEGLRIVPPAPGAFRQATRDLEYKGYTIPKGWTVFYYLRSTLTNEEYFKDSSKFDPDRFVDGTVDSSSFTYIPFGQGGNRMCPAMDFAKLQIQLFLYHTVLRYDLRAVNPDEQYQMFYNPVPKEGLAMKIFPVAS